MKTDLIEMFSRYWYDYRLEGVNAFRDSKAISYSQIASPPWKVLVLMHFI